MEVMAARIKGVIVPYAGGLETEQTLRADLLRDYAALQVLDENAVTPAAIANSVEAALAGPPAAATKLDTGGAENSARILAELAERCSAP